MDGETDLSALVIGAAIDVHRELGPGLLESAYRTCLVQELEARKRRVESEVPLAVVYRGTPLRLGFRIDLLVDRTLIVELKAVDALEAIHTAQLLTYLRFADRPLGLLINFNVTRLKDGIRRVIRSSPPPSTRSTASNPLPSAFSAPPPRSPRPQLQPPPSPRPPIP